MRSNLVPVALSLLGAAALAGCGYAMSGTWDDDPGNWERAFGGEPPADVVVEHSKYWRSAHFTYEFEYFFQVKPNEGLRESLFADDALVRVEGDEALREATRFFSEKPEWFLPKPIQEYEVWEPAEEPKGRFFLFIDEASGDLFLTDYQV